MVNDVAFSGQWAFRSVSNFSLHLANIFTYHTPYTLQERNDVDQCAVNSVEERMKATRGAFPTSLSIQYSAFADPAQTNSRHPIRHPIKDAKDRYTSYIST